MRKSKGPQGLREPKDPSELVLYQLDQVAASDEEL